jgi:uncharacterized glyoxalase superfamily protein PhnB
MRFTGASLITDDVPGLVAFYTAVLDVPATGDDVFATLPVPGATLSIFAADALSRMAPIDAATVVEVRVDDVDAAHERLQARGVPIVKPPTTQPWGRRSVWVRDPAGTVVNLYRDVPPPPDPAEVVVGYFRRLLVQRDLSACDDLLSADYLDHDAPPGTPRGPHATRAYVERLLADYPDLQVTLGDPVTLDRHVAVNLAWHGTHRQTGERLARSGLVLIRVTESGHLAERMSAYT